MAMKLPGAAAKINVASGYEKLCSRCLLRLLRPSPIASIKSSSTHTRRSLHGPITSEKPVEPRNFMHEYFSANGTIDRGWLKNGALAAIRSMEVAPPTKVDSSPVGPSSCKETRLKKDIQGKAEDDISIGEADTVPTQDLQSGRIREIHPSPFPHATNELPRRRRRKRLKAIYAENNDVTESAETADSIIPPDASSRLTTTAATLPSSASIRRTIATYLSLSKPRLSFLIVLTSTAAYSLYPIPDILASTDNLAATTSITLSASTLTLAYLSTGTFLSSACANTLNMLFEPQYDALMTRTRNRPLVRKLVTPTAASIFAAATGTTGLTLLYLGTNPTVAGLSALNILLYAGIYTPLKRISVLNTWIGAVVGAIPQLMGWAAAAGHAATTEHHSLPDLLFTTEALGGWLLATLLFAWQFPHFNALSHLIADEYRRAGYRMLAWTDPARNGRVALRYSLLLFPVCAALCWVGVVGRSFLLVSSACNLWIGREAYRFWKRGGKGGSARGLFWASIWSLPLLMVSALVCKKGVWDGVWDDGDPAGHEGPGESGGDEEDHEDGQGGGERGGVRLTLSGS